MVGGLGLQDVYDATIERIKAQGGDKARLGIRALMWACHAERPLSVGEFCHALAIELDSTDFNAGNVPSITTLVSCCQGLITTDKEGSTVRLIHFTLREYLSTHPDIFGRPHSALAEICLTYLNCPQVKVLSTDGLDHPDALFNNNPFLKYCSLYWGVHAKKDLSDCAMSLSLQLLREYDGHISAVLLAGQVWSFPHDLQRGTLWTGLHCASYFGIVQVVATLIGMGCYDLNQGDWFGCTALSLAAEMGHEEVAKFLLGQEGVEPHVQDNIGITPLGYAAFKGHAGLVNILLEREDVDPNKPMSGGETPLSNAAWYGQEGVVKILLGREDINPDMADHTGQTPLGRATSNGHQSVVALLRSHKAVNNSVT